MQRHRHGGAVAAVGLYELAQVKVADAVAGYDEDAAAVLRVEAGADAACGAERLILDVLLGEPSLFPVNEEVERSWEILDPVIEHWAGLPGGPDPYPAGSWGPESATRMLARTGRKWRRP